MRTIRESLRGGGPAATLAMTLTLLVAPPSGLATGDDDRDHGRDRHCRATARALFHACGNEAQDDWWTAQAICINVADRADRESCVAEARTARREAKELCREQLAGRREACEALGGGRYDPDFDPNSFDHDFRTLTRPNPYLPLGIGNRWEYRGGGESNVIEVLDETKLIDGVTCIVVNDIVTKDGDLVEDTDDWFAQNRDGNTWYCGEEVKDFESFDGDVPRKPELVSIDGSFKVGRNRDKPGIIALAAPTKGQFYVEEFSLGNAEDVSEVLSTTYAFGQDPELDELVPPGLAQLLCSDDCVVTRNFSLLEPGVFARKYYARGLGVFLEVNPDAEEVVQLVDCNFDPRCAALPLP